MTNDIQPSQTDPNKPIPFGIRLQSAREALGLDQKEAAAQLRLNEKMIVMMEKERYPTDLPATFIRGYLRAYGKLLQIPESEIKKAIEPIKPTVIQTDILTKPLSKPFPLAKLVTSSNYFMQFFTYLILLTLAGLVAMWWYHHPRSSSPILEKPSIIPLEMAPTAPVSPANAASSAYSSAGANQVIENKHPSTPTAGKETDIKPNSTDTHEKTATIGVETNEKASTTLSKQNQDERQQSTQKADPSEEETADPRDTDEVSANSDNTETNSDNAD